MKNNVAAGIATVFSRTNCLTLSILRTISYAASPTICGAVKLAAGQQRPRGLSAAISGINLRVLPPNEEFGSPQGIALAGALVPGSVDHRMIRNLPQYPA